MPQTGSFGSRAVAESRGVLALTAGDNAVSSVALQTEGLPYLHVWVQQLTPLVVGQGCGVLVQGSVRAFRTAAADKTGGLQNAWFTLYPLFILAPGVTTIPFAPFGLLQPVSKMRITIYSTVDTTVNYVISANG